jgi:pimeloyl-ACP methyl ester carboxylesterase
LADLVTQLQKLLPTVGIDVLAYSMGATLAIMLFHADVQQIDRLVLLAPNGDHRLRYRFFTRTWLGHGLFRRSLHQPDLLMGLIGLMHRSGLINDKLMRIIEEEYGSPERIRRVYQTYMAFSQKKWTYAALREIQARRKSQWHFVFGQYDRVIGPRQSRGLLKHLPHTRHGWESGHLLIQPQHLDKIQVLLAATNS